MSQVRYYVKLVDTLCDRNDQFDGIQKYGFRSVKLMILIFVLAQFQRIIIWLISKRYYVQVFDIARSIVSTDIS